MFWVISVYFNIRNTLPKSGTFLLGHLYIQIHNVSVYLGKYRKSVAASNTATQVSVKKRLPARNKNVRHKVSMDSFSQLLTY